MSGKLIAETIGLCPICLTDSPAFYNQGPDGVWLRVDCETHGPWAERVERDAEFFKGSYERSYAPAYNYLVLPVTYRCNIKCKYCYTLSNKADWLPPDRTTGQLRDIFARHSEDITFIGGEPTVRSDLPQLISFAKNGRRVGLCTNAQELSHHEYLDCLIDAGLDFIFFSFNHLQYDGPTVHKNKLLALDNCLRARIPVWLQQTIDDPSQLDILESVVPKYSKIIFKITIRTAKNYGLSGPKSELFVSDILEYLGQKGSYRPGLSPFNKHINLFGKKTKVCSWVADVGVLDPIDAKYIACDDRVTTFHRGIKLDEFLIKNRLNSTILSGAGEHVC